MMFGLLNSSRLQPLLLLVSASLCCLCCPSQAFVIPRSHSSVTIATTTTSPSPTTRGIGGNNNLLLSFPPASSSSTTTALHLYPTVDAAATAAASSSSDVYLWQYFWETVIANGVPATFALLVIFTAAFIFRPASNVKALQESIFGQENPAFALYQDLYGDQLSATEKKKKTSPLARFFRGGGGSNQNNNKKLPLNIGIPAQQYFQVTHLNRKLDSYQYSLTAATQNAAIAAASYRKASFARILLDNASVLPASTWQQLQQQERELLQQASKLLADLQAEQTLLAKIVLDQELQQMGLTESPYQLDPPAVNVDDGNANATTTTTTATTASSSTAAMTVGNKNKKQLNRKAQQQQQQQPNTSQILQSIAALQKSIQELELDFIKCIVQAVGPEHAATVRTALLGNLAVRGSGSLLRDLQDRPLNVVLSSSSSSTATAAADANANATNTTTTTTTTTPHVPKKKMFVTRFPGDATASQVATLREEVTAICQSARAGVDEALVVLQSGGGTVTGYGLAAAQLLRFKEAGLKLTIAVEQVAASGGYMMCCVADHIVASPFAVLGSIGVITDIPNVYERLKQEGIEFQTVTAGKYKRTLTPTKKVTREDFEKTKADVEDILVLFRDFVKENRPQLDIDAVATGETWFGTAALERNLCDEIKTVDAVLMDHVQNGYDVYEVKYTPPVETPFGKFLPARTKSNVDDDGDNASGLVRQAVRWLVRTVASEIKSELAASDFSSSFGNKPIQERYMMIDDRADRIKAQD